MHTISDGPLSRVRVVLIRTSESGNIGSAARAMKTMGLRQLALVAPAEFPSARATARASGADDLLAEAVVVDTLAEALQGCDLVMGTSARLRDLPWPLLDPREAAKHVMQQESVEGDIAVVFGSEHSGMTNEEMDACQFQIYIPASDTYSSLNLAAAVQVISYELRMAQEDSKAVIHESAEALASRQEMEHFYDHLFTVMRQVEYYRPEQPKLLQRRIRRLFNRPLMVRSEVQIMRGFLSMIEKHLKVSD